MSSKYKSVKARHDEIARLIALGTPVKDIMAQTGLSQGRICQIASGIVDGKIAELSKERDKSTAELQEQMMTERVKLAADIWKELRLAFDTTKAANIVDTKLCFSILDRTEGIPAKKLDIKTSEGLFSPEDIDKANNASEDMNE
jgi:hypothetical protein